MNDKKNKTEKDIDCNRECVKEAGKGKEKNAHFEVQDFVGPVRIVLVDPPEDQLDQQKSSAAYISLATMMMGANLICILMFCLGMKFPTNINSHIFLCTVGYQFCVPFGILLQNPLFGAAAPMKESQRSREHFGIQLFGMGLYGTGSALAILKGEKSLLDPPEEFTSFHFYSGCVAAGFTVICILTGPCSFFLKSSCVKSAHRLSGILAFVSSSVCFILGIFKPQMRMTFYILAYETPVFLIVLCCAFYTFVVLRTPYQNLVKRGKKI